MPVVDRCRERAWARQGVSNIATDATFRGVSLVLSGTRGAPLRVLWDTRSTGSRASASFAFGRQEWLS